MIEIVENFTGYPGGEKRQFTKGEKPTDLDQDYADLLVSKGLAKLVRVKGKSDEAK